MNTVYQLTPALVTDFTIMFEKVGEEPQIRRDGEAGLESVIRDFRLWLPLCTPEERRRVAYWF